MKLCASIALLLAATVSMGQSPATAPATQPAGQAKALQAWRRIVAGIRPAPAPDVEAREQFLAIERFARLPAAEQAKAVPAFYRDHAQRWVKSVAEMILSSAPSNILDRRSENGFRGSTEVWAKQLADAASKMTAEQVADKLGSRLWLDIAARARAIWVLKANAAVVEPLIQDDLKSGRVGQVQRAVSAIRAMELMKYDAQLLKIFLADGEASEMARRGLFMKDPAVVQALLARVESDPKLLARCAGMLEVALWHKPAEPVLLKLLDSPDAEVRYNAGGAVYECIDANLAAPAARFAKEDQPRFRVAAAHLAANLPKDAFAAVRGDLIRLLNDADQAVRLEAMRAFAQQKDLAACPVILELLMRDYAGLAGQHEVTVMQALAALADQHFGYDMHNRGPGAPGNAQAIRKFEAWMESRGVLVPRNFQPEADNLPAASPTTQPVAAGAAEIDRLIEQLGSEKLADRAWAQQALVRIGLPAVSRLREAASDKNAERAARAKEALTQIEWGRPNQGLKARLLPLRSAWTKQQIPELILDIRNGGRLSIEYSNAVMLYCRIEVDGQWYAWGKPFDIGMPTAMLAPGKEFTLKVCLTDDWATPPGIAPGVPGKDAKWLRLAPGRHLVRVSFTGYPELGSREGGIRCESNPVEVVIEGPAATQPAPAPVTQPAVSGKP